MDWKKRVKELRNHTGLTLEDFGRKIGVRMNTVWKWESGYHYPSYLARRRIEELEDQIRTEKGK